MCNATPLGYTLCCSKQSHCMQAPEASSTTDGAGPAAAGPLPAGLGQQMGQQWQAGEATYLAGMAQVCPAQGGAQHLPRSLRCCAQCVPHLPAAPCTQQATKGLSRKHWG